MLETFIIIDKIYYMVIAVIGVPVNLLALSILSWGKCRLSICTTRYLVAMATADLLVIITDVILYQINLYYFQRSFLHITPVCTVNSFLLCVASDCSVWFTVTFSSDRFVAICCQKLKTKYCTVKIATVILATTCILFCFKNIPIYFTREPGVVIDNVPWFCNMKPSYYIEPRWVVFDWFDKALTPLIPFALILLLNALTVRYILVVSQIRDGLRGQSKDQKHGDTEMESRRRSVILLFTISGSFILLWSPYVINFLYYSIAGIDPKYYNNSLHIFERIGYMLLSLSCCTNTFIYGVTQSKFREQFKSVVKYPLSQILYKIGAVFDCEMRFTPPIGAITKTAYFYHCNIACAHPYLSSSAAESYFNAFDTSKHDYSNALLASFPRPTPP
ncbi:probable G-protein coupled receptor 139 [Heterodontus francisci]|uniref:probable G-protein coupled receptor 139 n=1 Tax=Heterodontus francisci TaxID=7792 RepID=UPI00355BB8A1